MHYSGITSNLFFNSVNFKSKQKWQKGWQPLFSLLKSKDLLTDFSNSKKYSPRKIDDVRKIHKR